ncbi:MAG TPA: hypothetical protein PLE01_01470, partial [Syntrophothermus lipocalidus]|nr:hypothetical protein [Syntrophothermus lipocalidus]
IEPRLFGRYNRLSDATPAEGYNRGPFFPAPTLLNLKAEERMILDYQFPMAVSAARKCPIDTVVASLPY